MVVKEAEFAGAQDNLPIMNMPMEWFLIFYLGVI
jgi:hypothetical protein